MLVPTEPKIYHIVHVDRLASIISDGYLWSDAEARRRDVGGTAIGMTKIKERRLAKELTSHPDLSWVIVYLSTSAHVPLCSISSTRGTTLN